MKKLDQLTTLITEWNNLTPGNNFTYEAFSFTPSEFDNVPSVVPRFLIHLQRSLLPICSRLHQTIGEQSTASLKIELLQAIEQ
jgi:hypothetical protein